MLSIQSGPAGARPTRFWPADRIARLTPEASNARLHRESRPRQDRRQPAGSWQARQPKFAARVDRPEPRRHAEPDCASLAATSGRFLT